MVPSVKLPKNLRKLKNWHPNETLDTIGNIGNNISQLVNRYIYPQNNKNNDTKMGQHQTTDDSVLPPGVSTISGSYVSDNTPAVGAQKDNFGLYALKHDRSAAGKKGLLLHIPLKLHTKNKSGSSSNTNTLRKEINHEKFQSCENRKSKINVERGQSSSLDDSVGSVNDCQEIQFDIESDIECHQTKPAVPPRRRKLSQPSVTTDLPKRVNASITKAPPKLESQPPLIVENVKILEVKPTSLASFVVQNRPDTVAPRQVGGKLDAKVSQNVRKGHARNKSIDIFVREEKDVFQEFDKIFHNNDGNDSHIQVQGKRNSKKLPSVEKKMLSSESKEYGSSSSSLTQSSFEEEMAGIRANTERRFSSTIKVQNFNEQNIPRCKSFLSPKHKMSTKRSSIDKAIESESSSNELKSPTIVTNTAKKIPQGILKQRTPSPKDNTFPRNNQPETRPQVIHKPNSPVKQMEQNRKFFVYYNDEDELVFNQEYINLQKQNDSKSNNNNNSVASKNNVPAQSLSLYTGNPSAEQQHKLNLSDFNHNDVIYRNYYIDQNDSLRSMASSSDGIFI